MTRPRPTPKRRRRRWPRRLLLALAALLLLSALPVLLLRWLPPPTSAFMLAYRMQHDDAPRYAWRDLEQIAPALPLALVAAEDQRFPQHRGFDVDAIRSALAEHADGEDLRGASTISQQVAKNLFLWQGRSWVRKGLEVWYTLLIEALWPKSRILEMYANIAEFGDGIYGAQAAARQHWGKDAARLSPAESARLAAVLPAPRRYNAAKPGPFVQRRAAWIQRQARQLGGTAYLADD